MLGREIVDHLDQPVLHVGQSARRDHTGERAALDPHLDAIARRLELRLDVGQRGCAELGRLALRACERRQVAPQRVAIQQSDPLIRLETHMQSLGVDASHRRAGAGQRQGEVRQYPPRPHYFSAASQRLAAPASRAPAKGATQKAHSWPTAQLPWNRATPVERAGLTEVLVTGIEIR